MTTAQRRECEWQVGQEVTVWRNDWTIGSHPARLRTIVKIKKSPMVVILSGDDAEQFDWSGNDPGSRGSFSHRQSWLAVRLPTDAEGHKVANQLKRLIIATGHQGWWKKLTPKQVTAINEILAPKPEKPL